MGRSWQLWGASQPYLSPQEMLFEHRESTGSPQHPIPQARHGTTWPPSLIAGKGWGWLHPTARSTHFSSQGFVLALICAAGQRGTSARSPGLEGAEQQLPTAH